jgi:hypothetical protein
MQRWGSFWAARDASPETCHQRGWDLKIANVLDALPESVHKRAKKAIKGMTEAENKAEARKACQRVRGEVAQGSAQDLG